MAGDVPAHLWQWLVPPAVQGADGRLQPRRPARAPVPAPAREQTAPSLPQPTDLPAHPEANQQALLQGRLLHYRLQRSRRRSIGFTVGAQGLVVSAPPWVDMAAIGQALQAKAAWILRKLQEAGQRHADQQAARICWAHGGELDYLGRPLRLCLTGGEALPLRTRQAHREQASDGSQSLHLPLAPGAAPAEVRACVQAWMLREARAWFTASLQRHAPLLGVQWTSLRLTSARTRWGSANSVGAIRLNWRLMQHAPEVIDYVVVHELSHLRHMDHSPRFWATVAGVLPDWQERRQVLRDRLLPPWE
ncbi:MAG: M48 family metallopeptidase [Burkholderiaceae bacterium]|jgi:predicted metal-dependent hydrolase|nr:M48 family metallopeptidase [Burkholderiaceae bacterium]